MMSYMQLMMSFPGMILWMGIDDDLATVDDGFPIVDGHP